MDAVIVGIDTEDNFALNATRVKDSTELRKTPNGSGGLSATTGALLISIVVNESLFLEPIHEHIDSRTRGPDHLRRAKLGYMVALATCSTARP